MIGFIVFGTLIIIGFLIFLYEIKHSQTIPSDEPFLRGDYDPRKDPTLNHKKMFCDKCRYQGTNNTCKIDINPQMITDKWIKECRAEGFLELIEN